MSLPLAFAIDSLHGFELTEDCQYLMLNCKQSERIVFTVRLCTSCLRRFRTPSARRSVFATRKKA
jgi:hypothetical protein